MYVTRHPDAPQPEAPQPGGSVIQITFSRASLRLVFRLTSGGDSNETILFSRGADRAQFFGPCRSFDFIQRRQPSGAHRILQALPFAIVREDVDLQTPRLAPQA